MYLGSISREQRSGYNRQACGWGPLGRQSIFTTHNSRKDLASLLLFPFTHGLLAGGSMESPRMGPARPPSHLSGSQSSLSSEAGAGATEPQGDTSSRPEPRVPGEYCLASVCPAASSPPPLSSSGRRHFQFFMFTELCARQWGTKVSQTHLCQLSPEGLRMVPSLLPCHLFVFPGS